MKTFSFFCSIPCIDYVKVEETGVHCANCRIQGCLGKVLSASSTVLNNAEEFNLLDIACIFICK